MLEAEIENVSEEEVEEVSTLPYHNLTLGRSEMSSLCPSVLVSGMSQASLQVKDEL